MSKRTEEIVNLPYRLDCCPAETHLIHPRGGISRDGKIVELYRNYRIVQTFYQTSCRPEVQDRPCPLIDQKVRHLSRCVQKYSYVYAFMKDFNVSDSYRLDYLRVKSGCSCELDFSYPQVDEYPSQSLDGDDVSSQSLDGDDVSSQSLSEDDAA